jgi:hypothetical protein
MERLEKKSSNSIESLIKKLETLIVQDKISDEKLDTLQKLVDEIDEKMDEPDFQIFELQSIIYYARNDKSNSMAFISDAMSLNSDIKDYSKFGALLAEIYSESSDKIDQSETEDDISNVDKVEQEDKDEAKKTEGKK